MSGDYTFLIFCIIIDKKLIANGNEQKVFVRKLSRDYTFLKFCIIIYNKLIGNGNTQKLCKKSCL